MKQGSALYTEMGVNQITIISYDIANIISRVTKITVVFLASDEVSFVYLYDYIFYVTLII